jgi:hypothetical protein
VGIRGAGDISAAVRALTSAVVTGVVVGDLVPSEGTTAGTEVRGALEEYT